jgi:hypothetical protein
MEIGKDTTPYMSKEDWEKSNFIIMHGQTSIAKNEWGIELYSSHQVKPKS